jgi:putative transposase
MATKFKHCKRYNEAGHAHELTFTCFKYQQFLAKDRARNWLSEAIILARRKHSFHVWAYAFMPEHVHLLICPTTKHYDIGSILATIKLSVTRKALNHVKQFAPRFLPRMADVQPNGDIHYRFWQRGGGYDRNSTEPTTIWKQIDYIHLNPVRRGLCERPEEWYWSSAGVYLGLHGGPISIDKESLPRTPQG